MSPSRLEYVVFDLEANNDRSNPAEHEIIDIGAVLVRDGAEVASFETLVRPTRALRGFTTELTGLNDDDLADAPPPARALLDLYDFVGGRPMVAHNGLRYDFKLLDSAGDKADVPVPGVLRLDSLELAHLVFPRAGEGIVANIGGERPPGGRSLDALAHHMFGEEPRGLHRALNDARLLYRVLDELLRMMERDEPAQCLQRWALAKGRHAWSELLTAPAEPPGLESVVPTPSERNRAPATGVFDTEAVVSMFTEGGKLMTHGRQPRPQQSDMASSVADALCQADVAKQQLGIQATKTAARPSCKRLIEAPTGTGKTLAYLVPAIEYARAAGTTVVVAPHSKVLQDQIMSALEELADALEPFEYVLLKGRANYVDLEGLAGEIDALAEHPDSSTTDGAFALAMVSGWIALTPTGDWDDLRTGALDSGRTALKRLQRSLATEGPTGPANTELEKLDFHHRAQEALVQGDVQVAVFNHALIVTAHWWPSHSKHLILDEAHNLEDAATDALTNEIGDFDLQVLCDSLWDPVPRSGTLRRLADATGWSLRVKAAASVQSLESASTEYGRPRSSGLHRKAKPYEPLGAIRRAVELVRERFERFGEELVHYLRLRTGASDEDRYATAYRFRRASDIRHPDFRSVLQTGEGLREALRSVASALDDVNLPEKLRGRYRRRRLEEEIRRLGHAARGAAKVVNDVLWVQDPDECVAVGEIAFDSAINDWTWTLKRAPLSVAGVLGLLWESLEASVLTSATLRVNGNFSHIIDSLGLGSASQPLMLDSPFDPANHLLVLTDYLPAPRLRLIEEFKASAAAEIPRLLMLTGGRGMALMAARARMEYVSQHARPILDAEGIPLLVQGDDSSAALVERMRAERATSLIALRSFWEGVDIPGEALSLLMIEKVPFESPAEPIAGARMEALEDRGKDPFAHYMVPRAALRFAQGVGRLIRTESDRGVTLMLDNRLCRAVPYRDAILGTLPGPPRREQARLAAEAYRHIADHLGGIELDDDLLERLASVQRPDAWSRLAELEMSEQDAAQLAVIEARLEEARELFGFEAWRSGQWEIMRAFMSGSDFLAVLPTGSGKSITFQIPALLCPGLTLVISPLTALMNDQVENLRLRGISNAAAIHSGIPQSEWRDVLRGAARGDYKLLYVSPERLWSQEFVDTLAAVGVSRIAVDEAHCISQWGHSFRPEYTLIPQALKRLVSDGRRPPVLAVTATATKEVRDDIAERLKLDLDLSSAAFPRAAGLVGEVATVSHSAVVLSPDRPEIRYFVERCSNMDDRDIRVVQIVEAFRSRSAIVYVPTRKDTGRIAGLLRAAGHVSWPYHGGMESSERQHIEDAFRSGEIDVVVATKAFGMGIDKPDIELIVHLEMPATIEEYVQETGRAARGAVEGAGPAMGTAVLLCTPWDCRIHDMFVKVAAPSVEQVRRIWLRLEVGLHPYSPDDLDATPDGETDAEAVATALAVHYLQEQGALVRHTDSPWRGTVSVLSDTAQRLNALALDEPSLASRGREIVEQVGGVGSAEYRAKEWGKALGRAPHEVAADLFELNRRDVLGFTTWRHAWMLERHVGAVPQWAAIEATADDRRSLVARKSDRAKKFAKSQRGCRVRAMLEYFGAAASERCGRCDLCEPNLERPWANSHITRDGLLESLPVRRIVLRMLDDTMGLKYSRRNLERTLRGQSGSGDHQLPDFLRRHHLNGRLGTLSDTELTALFDELVVDGLAERVDAEYEGTRYDRLEITEIGRDYLRQVPQSDL